MATHSSTLAWRTPWMEEPGGLQSMGSVRVGHDCAHTHALVRSGRKGAPCSWEINGETVADFTFLGSKITADGDCSHEIKRRLLFGQTVPLSISNRHPPPQAPWLYLARVPRGPSSPLSAWLPLGRTLTLCISSSFCLGNPRNRLT